LSAAASANTAATTGSATNPSAVTSTAPGTIRSATRFRGRTSGTSTTCASSAVTLITQPMRPYIWVICVRPLNERSKVTLMAKSFMVDAISYATRIPTRSSR
jgi:hypothetical protein